MVLVNFRDLVQTVPPPGTTGKSGYFAVPWADINDLIKDDLIAVDRVVPIDGRRAGVGEMAVGLQRHDRILLLLHQILHAGSGAGLGDIMKSKK